MKQFHVVIIFIVYQETKLKNVRQIIQRGCNVLTPKGTSQAKYDNMYSPTNNSYGTTSTVNSK